MDGSPSGRRLSTTAVTIQGDRPEHNRAPNSGPHGGTRRRARQPTARLYAEYLMGFVQAIRSAPLSSRDRNAAYLALADYYGKQLMSALPARRRP